MKPTASISAPPDASLVWPKRWQSSDWYLKTACLVLHWKLLLSYFPCLVNLKLLIHKQKWYLYFLDYLDPTLATTISIKHDIQCSVFLPSWHASSTGKKHAINKLFSSPWHPKQKKLKVTRFSKIPELNLCKKKPSFAHNSPPCFGVLIACFARNPKFFLIFEGWYSFFCWDYLGIT